LTAITATLAAGLGPAATGSDAGIHVLVAGAGYARSGAAADARHGGCRASADAFTTAI
jgi:hypothetical protein